MTNEMSAPSTRRLTRGEKLRSAEVLRLVLAGVALLVGMGFQLAASTDDWSALNSDPAAFVRDNALGLTGVVVGAALVVTGLVKGLRR